MSELYAVMDVVRSIDLKLNQFKNQPEITLPLDWDDGQVGVIQIFDSESKAVQVAGDTDMVVPLEAQSEED